MQADTRIVPNETKPDCPFPQQLDLVAQANQGHVDIAAPIDVPFTEVSRLLQAQFAGKTFPEDGSGSFAAAVGNLAAQAPGLRASASVDDLRLVGIAYDSKTLLIIADAGGKVSVAISSLSMQ